MRRSVYITALVIAALAACVHSAKIARAQAPAPTSAQSQSQAPPAPAAGANLNAGTETGIGTFQTHCMGCHGNPNVPQAPAPAAIRQMSPERIYDALTTGLMKPQGDAFTDGQQKMLAAFLSGRPLGSMKEGDAKDMPNHCTSNPPLEDPTSGPEWNGWGPDVVNSRFQDAKGAGLTAAQVPKLKLKWAFGYPDGTFRVRPADDCFGARFCRHRYRVRLLARRRDGLRLLVVSSQGARAQRSHGGAGEGPRRNKVRRLFWRFRTRTFTPLMRKPARRIWIAESGRSFRRAHHRSSQGL